MMKFVYAALFAASLVESDGCSRRYSDPHQQRLHVWLEPR